jgi:hypothetical protein
MISLFLKHAPLNACLITHFPSIRVLTNIYALINFKNTVDCTTYYTLHTYTVPHQYVCRDDSSDFSANWRSSHIYRDSPPCMLDVLSDWSVDWIPIYTHHTYKVLNSMYVLMWYQTALSTEFVFRHITNTRALNNIYGLRNFKNNLLTVWLTTH